MTTETLQQTFEACLSNKTAWLTRRQELADTEQEYHNGLVTDEKTGRRSLQTLRDIIDLKKWEINQAADRYIRSHENVQRISIRDRLNDLCRRTVQSWPPRLHLN